MRLCYDSTSTTPTLAVIRYFNDTWGSEPRRQLLENQPSGPKPTIHILRCVMLLGIHLATLPSCVCVETKSQANGPFSQHVGRKAVSGFLVILPSVDMYIYVCIFTSVVRCLLQGDGLRSCLTSFDLVSIQVRPLFFFSLSLSPSKESGTTFTRGV